MVLLDLHPAEPEPEEAPLEERVEALRQSIYDEQAAALEVAVNVLKPPDRVRTRALSKEQLRSPWFTRLYVLSLCLFETMVELEFDHMEHHAVHGFCLLHQCCGEVTCKQYSTWPNVPYSGSVCSCS